MSMTKRSRRLLAVFLIGLIALVADRTILRPQGGPGAASAAMESGDSGLLSGNVPVLQSEPAGAGVAERLHNLWSEKEPDFEHRRNPFALPASWFGTPEAPGERMSDVMSRFIRTHQLAAVVLDGEKSYAHVDDRFLVPGQILDGFMLVSVGDRSAVFEREGAQAVLELISK